MELDKVTQLSWRRFLSTEAGIKGIQYWRDLAPSVHQGESHNIIFQAGVSQGFREAVNALPNIIGAEPEKTINLEPDYAMEK